MRDSFVHRLRNAFLCVFVIATLLGNVARAQPLSVINDFFAWAEREYNTIFPCGPTTQTLPPSTYRVYTTGHYLAVSAGKVYVLGPLTNNQLRDLGSFGQFASLLTSSTSTGCTNGGTSNGGTSGSGAVSSVSLTPSSNTLEIGQSYRLTAKALESSGSELTGRTVTWESSNTAIATVDNAGLAKAIAAGTAQITARVDGKSATAALTVNGARSTTLQVQLDLSGATGSVRDMFGVNRRPTAAARTLGTSEYDGTNLYKAFGVSQVRMHDTGVDLCTTYTAAAKLNMGTNPPTTVSGCTLVGTASSQPKLKWTPNSTADADLNNPDNYDFTEVDTAIRAALATGAQIYLRLGESFDGPNDTDDPVAWAKVATNIYRHVIGEFKPTQGIAVDPVFVEIHNEPDGGFWTGSLSTFNSLFRETASRVKAAATSAGRTVKVGGAGFTHNVLKNAVKLNNPANNFISNVGASTIDFYSAHLYDTCTSATLTSSATFLRNLRSLVNTQGGSSKPIHLTEWNIGLGQSCGNTLYGEPRMQSYASGVLSLLQDPSLSIEAAHFYAGMPIMALFDFTLMNNAVRINPSAWAFWAHSKLKGGSLLTPQVCTGSSSCVAGYASDASSFMAVGALTGTGNDQIRRLVITNDSSSEVAYSLQLSNLVSGSNIGHTITINSPPSGNRDVSASGNPMTVGTTALNALMSSPTQQIRSSLVTTTGQLSLTLTIPGNALQLIELSSQ